MGYRCDANDRGRFRGVGGFWHRRPDAGLDVQSGVCMAILGVLKIGHAKDVDVALQQSAIGDLAFGFFELQRLVEEIERQEAMVPSVVVGPPDDIEPLPVQVPGKSRRGPSGLPGWIDEKRGRFLIEGSGLKAKPGLSFIVPPSQTYRSGMPPVCTAPPPVSRISPASRAPTIWHGSSCSPGASTRIAGTPSSGRVKSTA